MNNHDAFHIVQIAPEIGPGTGVGMVAYALEREFLAAGCHVERFTLADARHKPTRIGGSRIALAWDVVWFSTFGTRHAKSFLAQRPKAVSICHNDVLAGDVYVNHGTLRAAMRARGHYALRMLRNPLHLFTFLRDRARYRGGTHRAIVTLSSTEIDHLHREYGRVRAPITVIPNGVDLERFRPPDEDERDAARARLNLTDEDRVALFIGHEFERKGLPVTIAALALAPTVLLLVVGGDERLIRGARTLAQQHGVAERVLFVGEQADVTPFLTAADMFVLPSAYEANALVALEALAFGLPVIAAASGFAPDIIEDGVNGFLVPRDAATIADRLETLATTDPTKWRRNARESVLPYSWENIARRYLTLAEDLAAQRPNREAATDTGTTP